MEGVNETGWELRWQRWCHGGVNETGWWLRWQWWRHEGGERDWLGGRQKICVTGPKWWRLRWRSLRGTMGALGMRAQLQCASLGRPLGLRPLRYATVPRLSRLRRGRCGLCRPWCPPRSLGSRDGERRVEGDRQCRRRSRREFPTDDGDDEAKADSSTHPRKGLEVLWSRPMPARCARPSRCAHPRRCTRLVPSPTSRSRSRRPS